jgi:hypothetical protein
MEAEGDKELERREAVRTKNVLAFFQPGGHVTGIK